MKHIYSMKELLGIRLFYDIHISISDMGLSLDLVLGDKVYHLVTRLVLTSKYFKKGFRVGCGVDSLSDLL